MIGVLRSQQGQIGPVEVHAVEVPVAGVAFRLAAAGSEVDPSRLLVDADDVAHQPLARGDLVLELSRPSVVEIQVPPAVALREPDDLFPPAEDPDVGLRPGGGVQLQIGLALLFENGPHGARRDIQLAEAAGLAAPGEVDEVDAGAVRAPPGVLELDGGEKRCGNRCPVRVHPLPGLDIEDEQLGVRDLLVGGHGVAVGVEHRPRTGVGRRRLKQVELLHPPLVEAHGEKPSRVGRPDRHRWQGDARHPGRHCECVGVRRLSVGVGGFTVLRERPLLTGLHGPQDQIRVTAGYGPAAVGREQAVGERRREAIPLRSGFSAALERLPIASFRKRAALAGAGVDPHDLGSVPRLPLVPEAVAVVDPVRPHLDVADPRAHVPGEELLRARVVLGGELAR